MASPTMAEPGDLNSNPIKSKCSVLVEWVKLLDNQAGKFTINNQFHVSLNTTGKKDSKILFSKALCIP